MLAKLVELGVLPCHVRLWPTRAKEQVIEVARNSYCWHGRLVKQVFARRRRIYGIQS